MKVTPLRVITDGACFVAHQDSEFFGPKVIIDVFRLEDEKIAEHWDVVQTIPEEFAHDNGMF